VQWVAESGMTVVNFTSVRIPSVAVFVQRRENGMANIHIPSACERQMRSHVYLTNHDTALEEDWQELDEIMAWSPPCEL